MRCTDQSTGSKTVNAGMLLREEMEKLDTSIRFICICIGRGDANAKTRKPDFRIGHELTKRKPENLSPSVCAYTTKLS